MHELIIIDLYLASLEPIKLNCVGWVFSLFRSQLTRRRITLLRIIFTLSTNRCHWTSCLSSHWVFLYEMPAFAFTIV